MKNRQPDSFFDRVVAQALFLAVEMAFSSVPVVGPVLIALSAVSDAKALEKALR